jgi:hypothetical protein
MSSSSRACCCDRIAVDQCKWSVQSFGIMGGAMDGGSRVTANKTARTFDYAKQCVSQVSLCRHVPRSLQTLCDVLCVIKAVENELCFVRAYTLHDLTLIS